MDTINKKQKVKSIKIKSFTIEEINKFAESSSLKYHKGINSEYIKGFVNGFIEAQNLLNK